MIPEIGQFALALALGAAVVQSVLPMLGAARNNLLWMRSARSSAIAQLMFISIAFATPNTVTGTPREVNSLWSRQKPALAPYSYRLSMAMDRVP